VALDETSSQLRIGPSWGPVVPLDETPPQLVELARRFLGVRGNGADAPWHVEELPESLVPPVEADPRTPLASHPLPYGAVDGGTHAPAPDGVLDAAAIERLAPHAELVVTPWHGVLVPDGEEER
jgi:precorrin-3B synthase